MMILVAHSGSPSDAALTWAAAAAARRGDTLQIITVISLPANLVEAGMDIPPEMVDAANEVLERAAERARAAGATDVQTLVGYRDAAGAIIEAAREADLVVVGSRGHGEAHSALLGSVAYAVTQHAPCPVVVIRGDHGYDVDSGHPVVVGIDGSRAGVHAAYFAAEIAQSAGCPLHVVAVWDVRPLGGFSREFAARIGIEGLSDPAQNRAQEWVDLALAKLGERFPGLEVIGRTVEGSAVLALQEAAEKAGLLVVGSRGRGGFTGLLLGSVSHKLIHEDGCPIAIVR